MKVENLNVKALVKYPIIAMCGLPGSGKSYFSKKIAQEWGYIRLSSDDIRVKRFVEPGENKFYNDDSKYEKNKVAVYQELYQKVVKAALIGKSVVIDATHLGDQRQLLIQVLKEKELLESGCFFVIKSDFSVSEQRVKQKAQTSGTGEDDYKGWLQARTFFERRLQDGEITYPTQEEGLPVYEWTNN